MSKIKMIDDVDSVSEMLGIMKTDICFFTYHLKLLIKIIIRKVRTK